MNADASVAGLLSQLEDPDPSIRRQAAEMLELQGDPAAVPALIERLEDPNRGVQQAAVDALTGIGGQQTVEALVLKLDNDSAVTRNLSLEILLKIGHTATHVLVPHLKSPSGDLRKIIADILGESRDPSVVPDLMVATRDPDPNVRTSSIEALGKLRDPRALKALVAALKDPEAWIRFTAAEALGSICDESTIKVLMNSLSQCDDVTAFSIVEALGEVKTKDAVPILVDFLPRASLPLRNCAIKALVRIAEGHEGGILRDQDMEGLAPYLIAALSDADPEVQEAALKALRRAATGNAVFPLLDYAVAVEDTDEEKMAWLREALAASKAGKKLQSVVANHEKIVFLAVQAIGDLGEESALPTLVSAFGMASSGIRKAIVQAMGNFKTDAARQLLLDALEDEDGGVRKGAVASLRKLGFPDTVGPLFTLLDREPYPDVRNATVDALLKLYEDGLRKEEILKGFKERFAGEDANFRELSIQAIGKIDSPEKEGCLGAALQDREWRVRNAAIHSLGGQKQSPWIFSLLKKGLADENENVRISAIHMISEYEGKETRDLLMDCMKDPDVWVKFKAAETLGLWKVREAVPSLLALLKEGTGPHLIATVRALGEIGDPSATDLIKGLLAHEDAEISQAAHQALAQLGISSF